MDFDLPAELVAYLRELDAFIEREITFTDASAGRRTAEFILGILKS